MEAFDEIYDDAPREIPAERVCQALKQSLQPMSDQVVALLDNQELDRNKLSESYVRFAVPTAMLSRAILEEMDEGEEVNFPGLKGLIWGCPSLDKQLTRYLDKPERDELLSLAEIWMGVKSDCEEMLGALQG